MTTSVTGNIMRNAVKLILFGGVLGAVPLSPGLHAQPLGSPRAEGGAEGTAVPGCPRPADAKDAKVVDFDKATSVAKLAVNIGSGRFKLVRITGWDRPDDARALNPVIEAARITQGNLQFYTPNLNADPESAHDSFVLIADMGGGQVCWATPNSLIKEGAYPIAQEAKPALTRAETKPAAPSEVARPAITPAEATPAVTPTPAPSIDDAPRRSRTTRRGRAIPVQ